MKTSNRIEEYRAGNYVACAKLGSFGKITSTTATAFPPGGTLAVDVWNKYRGDYIKRISIDYIQPIPLTEELIGYALSDVFQRVECDHRPAEFEIPKEVLPGIMGTANWSLVEDEDEKGKWWLSAGVGSILTQVKSLHHLQNLFFDLEGEELEIDKNVLKSLIRNDNK